MGGGASALPPVLPLLVPSSKRFGAPLQVPSPQVTKLSCSQVHSPLLGSGQE